MASNPIPGYDGLTADDQGYIWDSNGLPLNAIFNVSGEAYVMGVLRAVLVCSAFNGPAPSPTATVTHLDGNLANDAPTNLAWKS